MGDSSIKLIRRDLARVRKSFKVLDPKVMK